MYQFVLSRNVLKCLTENTMLVSLNLIVKIALNFPEVICVSVTDVTKLVGFGLCFPTSERHVTR